MADGLLGPITVFNYTVYDIITPHGTNYFAFMCWIGLYVIRNPLNGKR